MDILTLPMTNFEEIELVSERIIDLMEKIDDDIFEKSQRPNLRTEETAKLQSIGTSLNSCTVLFTYLDTYEESKKRKFDFLKLKFSMRKLIKILIDLQRHLTSPEREFNNFYT